MIHSQVHRTHTSQVLQAVTIKVIQAPVTAVHQAVVEAPETVTIMVEIHTPVVQAVEDLPAADLQVVALQVQEALHPEVV